MDEAEFTVRVGRDVVGREAVIVREVPGGAGALRITVNAWYPEDAGAATRAVTLELAPDGAARSLQVEGAGSIVLAGFTGRRITVRIGRAGGNEAVREYPGGPNVLAAPDSALSLFAVAPALRGRVRMFDPLAGRPSAAVLEESGDATITVAGRRHTLRHFTVRTGADTLLHLWYDTGNRLMKVERVDRGIIAERVSR